MAKDLSQSQFFTLSTMLIEDEGFRAKPYRCTAGKLTIGIGRNLEDKGLTKEEALYLLSNDIKVCFKELSDRLPWFNALDEIRQMVLINMAFNLGTAGLLKFKNTLSLIAAGEYKKASLEMLDSVWARQVGKRALRLSKMLESGEY